MNSSLACTVLLFLLSAAFTLATLLEPRSANWNQRNQSGGLFKMVFGEGRRLFANHFFTQADVYFHSGYYPSVFDQQAKPADNAHLMGDGHADHDGQADAEDPDHHDDHESEHYRQMAKGAPRDWVERFGRNFMVTAHTHLAAGNEREMLPWLKLSAEMDPQRIDTYTVTAYWLRTMGKLKEAEDFLRLGLKHNPESYEILFELASLLETQKDDARARNIWRMALHRWRQQEEGKDEPDKIGHEKIVMRLAKLEERHGNLDEALMYLRLALKTAPNPQVIQDQIDQLSAGRQ